jgi:hypothetical protein
VLRQAKGVQKVRYKNLATRVRNNNKALMGRSDARRPAPSVKRPPSRRPGTRFTRNEVNRLKALSRTNPAVARLMRAGTRLQRANAIKGLRKPSVFGKLNNRDKLALSRVLRNHRYLSRKKSLNLFRLSGDWDPRQKAIIDKLLLGLRLTRMELAFLRWQLRMQRDWLYQLALAAALRDGLWLESQGQALESLVGTCTCLVHPGGPGEPGQEDPQQPADPYVYAPTDPENPDGSGVAISFSPGEDDPTVTPATEEGEEEGEEAEETANPSKTLLAVGDSAGESLQTEQTTRRLRLRNATKKKITVHVQYRTRTETGDPSWFPGEKPDSEEENAVPYEVPAGKTVDIEDNDWPVHANKARVWAEGDGKKWHQFKDKDLNLVPEKDQDNQNAYKAAVPQTATLAFN